MSRCRSASSGSEVEVHDVQLVVKNTFFECVAAGRVEPPHPAARRSHSEPPSPAGCRKVSAPAAEDDETSDLSSKDDSSDSHTQTPPSSPGTLASEVEPVESASAWADWPISCHYLAKRAYEATQFSEFFDELPQMAPMDPYMYDVEEMQPYMYEAEHGSIGETGFEEQFANGPGQHYVYGDQATVEAWDDPETGYEGFQPWDGMAGRQCPRKACLFYFKSVGCSKGEQCLFCHERHHERVRSMRPSKSTRKKCKEIRDDFEDKKANEQEWVALANQNRYLSRICTQKIPQKSAVQAPPAWQ